MGFIRVAQYPQFVANIMLVPKKNGRLRMCVDFRNLKNISPKYDLSLPHANILANSAIGRALKSFTDIYVGYNQAKMVVDMEINGRQPIATYIHCDAIGVKEF